MSLAKQYAAELEQKRAELMQLFQIAETNQVDPQTGQKLLDATKITPEEVMKRESELAELEQKYQVARLAEIKQENEDKFRKMHDPEYRFRIPGGEHAGFVPAQNIKADGTPVTITDLVMQSVEYKGRNGNRRNFGINLDSLDPKGFLHPEIKTLFVSANMAPDQQRLPGAVPFAVRPLRVADVIPSETTNAPEIEYFEQTLSPQDDAATVSESDSKPEAATEYTLRSAKLEVIAAWIPATKQALDDIPQLRSLLETDLRYAVLKEEENQILTGNNTSPNIRGFLSAAALAAGVQTQAFDTNNADTLYKAMTLVRWTGYAEPTAVIIHPNNWQTIRLMKDSNNNYIWGPPSVAGVETIWGKPVVVTNAITANTALLGDFAVYSQIWRKMGLQVDFADQHDDYFIKNKVAIRAEERMTLIIKRPSAFARATSLT